jgi:hypothetical protein
VLAIAIATGGCEATSNSAVTSQSIVVVPAGPNLILDGRFNQALSGPWEFTLPAGAQERRGAVAGQDALIIAQPAPGGQGPLVLQQATDVLPDYRIGATYVLRALVRTVAVTRPIETELKLDYAGGGYGFFGSTASTPAPSGRLGRYVSGTTDGWLTVEVRATAQLPLTSIDAFVIDAPDGAAFAGTISVKNVTLYSER